MSLLAASAAAAYNKELSLISPFILHLGFDPGYVTKPFCFIWDTYFSFFF